MTEKELTQVFEAATVCAEPEPFAPNATLAADAEVVDDDPTLVMPASTIDILRTVAQ